MYCFLNFLFCIAITCALLRTYNYVILSLWSVVHDSFVFRFNGTRITVLGLRQTLLREIRNIHEEIQQRQPSTTSTTTTNRRRIRHQAECNTYWFWGEFRSTDGCGTSYLSHLESYSSNVRIPARTVRHMRVMPGGVQFVRRGGILTMHALVPQGLSATLVATDGRC